MNALRAAHAGGLAHPLSRSSIILRSCVALCLFPLLPPAFADESRGVAPIGSDPVNVSQPVRIGKDYALLFATDQYDDPKWPQLSNPVNDATALAGKLSSKFGFKTEVVTNATADEVIMTLLRYRDRPYERDDQLLVFFAGHGTYDPKLHHGYVVAKDSQYVDLRHKSYLDHEELLDTIAGITNCHHVLVILDVCFGGAIGERISVASYRGYNEYDDQPPATIVTEGLKNQSRLFLTSGGLTLVPDGRPGENSPFTKRLLAIFSDGGKDGVLTMKDIRADLGRINPMPYGGTFEGNTPEGDFLFISEPSLRGMLPGSNPGDANAISSRHDPTMKPVTPVAPASPPRARPALTQLKLGDFSELFGLKIGAKTDEVRALLGEATTERTEGGSLRDQILVWTYRAGGMEVQFDNQTKVVRSISFDADHLSWLAARGVDDPKLALLGKSSGDIEKLIGRPTMNYTSTSRYEGTGLDVEFFCPEYNRSKCSRITVYWAGQQP
ncbi:MAG TPA: caspase family protein [Candidatus Acidoferrales bacterium]|nr:caspase family protein [Candidatus Acidoferrales bacterium]